ncbi:MAG: DNA primase small subunit domain-containing protein [Candidatus Dormiibacterota bacterium]
MPSPPPVQIEVSGRTVNVTNAGKVYFPERGLTKLDLVNHVLTAQEGLLRSVGGRPVHLDRYPGGQGTEQIYQKRVPERRPDWLQTAEVQFPNGRRATVLCPVDAAHLAWAANLGTLLFHPWPTRAADNDHPDLLRIDFDPQEGTGFAQARTAAGIARELLQELGYQGWPKTSGGRGVHVLVPIEPRWDFVEVRRAAIAFARAVERRAPDRVTTAWWKEERGRRVFIDFNQTARDRTICSSYSVRNRPQAVVSMPVTWDELERCESEDFTIETTPARLADGGDRHAGIEEHAFDLAALLEWAERDRVDRGLGDLPYPPNFPKMAGEPMRVQPSRARKPVPEE